ncbi:hypothetical protein P9112_014155 [Eukaryota sp. TZLM1-RC]
MLHLLLSFISSYVLKLNGRVFLTDSPPEAPSSVLSKLRRSSELFCMSAFDSIDETTDSTSSPLVPIGAVCSPSMSCTVSLDIGGSLLKFLYFEPLELAELSLSSKFDFKPQLSVMSRTFGGKFHFFNISTSEITQIINFIKTNSLHSLLHSIPATGGGAHKFNDLITKELTVPVTIHDEMDSLVAGLNFFLNEDYKELFQYFPVADDVKFVPDQKSKDDSHPSKLFPYLLVNVGSGVSILKVDGENEYARVSGSGLGGATFFAIAKLLLQEDCSYDTLLSMARKGDSRKVDMLVGDIYGSNYSTIGLSSDVTAAFFGKLLNNQYMKVVEKEDLVRATLMMITGNIAHIAYLNASKYGIKRILFAGHFFRHDKISMASVSRGVHFWSAGQVRSYFLKHEGYLGVMGSWMLENKKFRR